MRGRGAPTTEPVDGATFDDAAAFGDATGARAAAGDPLGRDRPGRPAIPLRGGGARGSRPPPGRGGARARAAGHPRAAGR